TRLRGRRPGHLHLGGCAFDGRHRDRRPELRHLVARVDRRPRADLAAIDIGTLTLDGAGLLRRWSLLGTGGGCRGQEDETTGALQLSWHGRSPWKAVLGEEAGRDEHDKSTVKTRLCYLVSP